MKQSTTSGTQHFSGACSLAALGLYVQEIKLFDPIRQQVHIPQKLVKDHPIDKLYDLWIAMLAGLERVERNRVLRADASLQRAFGRTRCAEQSVVQQMLDACTPETIEEMRSTLTQIARQYGLAWQPRAAHEWLILDVDLCALPCGKQAEHATKGYFEGTQGPTRTAIGSRLCQSDRGNRRRFARVLGHTHLSEVLQALVEQAQENLQLDETAREETLIRCDAGGGTIDNINWLLSHGYGVLCKEFSGKRAKAQARHIEHWITDPSEPGRILGVVERPCLDYQHPHLVRRLVVRTLPPGDPQAQPSYAVLLSKLSPQQIFWLLGRPSPQTTDQQQVAQATLDLYDLRGGGVETSFKGTNMGWDSRCATRSGFVDNRCSLCLLAWHTMC